MLTFIAGGGGDCGGETPLKPETTVQDGVSVFVSVKPLDVTPRVDFPCGNRNG